MRDDDIFRSFCKSGNHTKILEKLLEEGVDINGKNRYNGDFALSIVVEYQNFNILKFLINHNADINNVTYYGWKVIHIASSIGFKDGVKYLLEKGADINSRTRKKETPLHLASIKGNIDIVEFLILNGADYNAQDYYGITPLQNAALYSQADAVNMLASFGADVNSRVLFLEPIALFDTKRYMEGKGVELLFKNGYDITITGNLPFKRYDLKNSSEIYNVIKKQMIKLIAANLCPDPIPLSMFAFYANIRNDEYTNYEKKCLTEINELKNKTFSSSKISFYDFLIKNNYQLAKYLKNENITSELDFYKDKFPIYYDMILLKFKQAHVRLLLSNSSSKYLYHISNYKLPIVAINLIMRYLTNKDMKIFVEAFSVTNPKNIPSLSELNNY